MAKIDHVLSVISQTLNLHASASLAKFVPFEDHLLQVCKVIYENIVKKMSANEFRATFRELIYSSPTTIDLLIQDCLMVSRPPIPDEFHDTVRDYLQLIPIVCRQVFRRSGDVDGISVPESFQVTDHKELLPLLPDRLSFYQEWDRPLNLDNWELRRLRGLGIHSEIWESYDDQQPELSPAAMKFCTDKKLSRRMLNQLDYIQQILDLDFIQGLVPLRSVFLDCENPCFEYVQMPGYDLVSIMNEFRWRHNKPSISDISMIVRRISRIIGKLHQINPRFVHCGLKPSNVFIMPRDRGRVTAWISDIGWSGIALPDSLQAPTVVQMLRRGQRGSNSYLYFSPQLRDGHAPVPQDDVYAIGMIWYQMLCNDPTAIPRENGKLAEDLSQFQLPVSQIQLLEACLHRDVSRRPKDGLDLSDCLAANASIYKSDSGTHQVNQTSEDLHLSEIMDEPIRPKLKLKSSVD
ncbi:MAG: hypothetical protein R3B84_05595 [Zavarzinella sp.]